MLHETSDAAEISDVLPTPPVNQSLDSREIVHVVRQYAPGIGGLEEFVAKLAARQLQTFRKVRVLTCNRIFAAPGARLPAREVIDGVEVERLPYIGSRRYPIVPGLWRALASTDIVHVHAIDFAFDALALTRALHRKTVVATTHGGFFHTSKFATLKTIWFNTLTRASVRGYDALVCCSESDLTRFAPIADGRAQMIVNGVDVEKFSGASAPDLTRNLVTLGRFSSNKRLDRLIDVMVHLKKNDPAWHLDICGVPGDVSEETLRAQITRNRLEKQVEVHVGLSSEALREVLERCSFFVSASEYEGFGLALIEAMSAGLVPVVHANAAFQAFAAVHAGVVTCDFARPEEAAQRILQRHDAAAANLEWLRQQSVDAARHYSWDRVKLEYDRVYATALEGHARVGSQF
ncbi:glycosyltransferase family 4 protein [Breoghania corrubedonensis]|uniref:glycosyltransferase family 4 protein n=1 Tax=Breoghania corrubedonensis TaxID=665038 RepID=UPI001FE7CEC5|nr:glycosyltransferase family 4 protein [Breoghania corrubedonensis]